MLLEKIVFKISKHIPDTVEQQTFWEKVHRLALRKMHIGTATNVQTSGELEALRFVLKSLPPGRIPVVFDVGANVGEYAAAVIHLCQKQVRLYCFEPNTVTFQQLKTRMACESNVFLLPIGLSDHPQEQLLYTHATHSGMDSLYERRLAHFDQGLQPAGPVCLTTLDIFCAKEDIDHIDYLKLDIEGHELAALKGACGLLEKDAIHAIQFEMGGCNIDARTFFQDFYYLLKQHYQIYRILRHGLYPLTTYQETMECFTTTNYLALHRDIFSDIPAVGLTYE